MLSSNKLPNYHGNWRSNYISKFPITAATPPPAGGWTPEDLGDLVVWYDADDASTITEVGGAVSQWNDKSGNGNHLTQGNGADQPILTAGAINGRTALNFNDRTKFMNLNDLVTFEWVAVVITRQGYENNLLNYVGSRTQSDYIIQYRGNIHQDRWQNAYYTNGGAFSNVGARAAVDPSIVINDTLNVAQKVDVDLQIGGDRGIGYRGAAGYIAEVIMGDTPLTVDNREKLEGYLASKWGTQHTLPDAHPHRFDWTLFDEGKAWTPLDLIELVTWHDAKDASTITEIGGSISQWDDKSGNGHHATQGNGSNQPTYDAVDEQVEFDGSDILKVGDNASQSDPYKDLQDFAVVTIGRWGFGSTNNNMFASWWGSGGGGGTSNGWNFRQRNGLALTMRPGNDSGGNVDPPISQDFIGAGARVAGNDMMSRINGEETYSSNNNQVVSYGTGDNRSAIGGQFGSDNWGSPGFFLRNGSAIKEQIVINNPTLADIQRAEGYLAWKWGKQSFLAENHPHRYDGRIFGYGEFWTPSEVAAELWYDGNDETTVTETATLISQWDDKSGNGRHLLQPLGSAQPRFSTINDLDCVRHLFQDSMEATFAAVDLTEFTVLAVQSFDNGSFCNLWRLRKADATDDLLVRRNLTNNQIDMRFTVDSNLVGFTTGGPVLGVPHIMTFEWKAGWVSPRFNGSGGGGFGNPGTVNLEEVLLGWIANGSTDQRIGEFLVIPSGDTSELERAEGYLAHKWGYADELPATHYYKNNSPKLP